MKSTSETGHAKNVANFQHLIEFVTAYGDTYNPSKKSLQLPQLIALKATAESSLAEVLTKNTLYNNKVNERLDAFSGLRPLSTRLVNALESTDATSQTIEDAKTYNRKIQGKKHPPLNHRPTPMHPFPTRSPQVSSPMTSSYNTLQDLDPFWKQNQATPQMKKTCRSPP